MHSRRPDLEIRANFFNQLLAFESRLQKNGQGAKTYNWNEVNPDGDEKQEELVLRNTYLNAQAQGVAEFKDPDASKQKINKWADTERSTKLITLNIPPYDKIAFDRKSKSQIIHRPKSIVKGSNPNISSGDQPDQEQPQKSTEMRPPSALKITKKESQKNFRDDGMQLSLNQIANKQLQQKFQKDDNNNRKENLAQDQMNNNSLLSKQKQMNATMPPTKTNNFMNSNEQWFNKTQKVQKNDILPPASSSSKNNNHNLVVEGNRPSTAPINKQNLGASLPRQNKNIPNELMIAPFKRQGSLGTRTEQNNQGQNQFKPQRVRAFSPNNVYSQNPYAQRHFKSKQWKR